MSGNTAFGLNALMNLSISIICIVFCWRLLLMVRIESLLRTKRPGYAKLLLLVLSIVLGHLLASFFIDYFTWTQQISQMLSS
jgi:uncharacterized membrane protein YwzB